MSGVTALWLMGVLARRWVPLFRNYLVPATVIAGNLGFLDMNLGAGKLLDGVDSGQFGSITTQLFTLTFISIGLTAAPKMENPENPENSENSEGTTKRRLRDSPLLRVAWLLGTPGRCCSPSRNSSASAWCP